MIEKKIAGSMEDVVNNWTNGNKKDAAKTIRSMTKLGIVYLITHIHEVDTSFIGNNLRRLDFEDFVINSLSGMYQ